MRPRFSPLRDASARLKRTGVACLFLGLGELDEGAANFEHAVQAGFRNRRWIEMDPDLEPIRGHPRYQAALATLD